MIEIETYMTLGHACMEKMGLGTELGAEAKSVCRL